MNVEQEFPGVVVRGISLLLAMVAAVATAAGFWRESHGFAIIVATGAFAVCGWAFLGRHHPQKAYEPSGGGIAICAIATIAAMTLIVAAISAGHFTIKEAPKLMGAALAMVAHVTCEATLLAAGIVLLVRMMKTLPPVPADRLSDD